MVEDSSACEHRVSRRPGCAKVTSSLALWVPVQSRSEAQWRASSTIVNPGSRPPTPKKPMRYYRGVSFPRSGHHLLIRLLEGYFVEADFKYTPKFERDDRPHPLPPPTLGERLLVRLGLARRLPALASSRPEPELTADRVRSAVILSKNHDFGLSMVNDYAIPTLVQYRSPLLASISNYFLFMKQMGLDDTRSLWDQYVVKHLSFWKSFVRKWVLDGDHPMSCHVAYEDLVDQPGTALERVVRFFFPDREPQRTQIESACSSLEIIAPRRAHDFQHFDPESFSRLEATVATEMRELGLASFRHLDATEATL